MYSEYLVNNRLYLKEEISIQCAEYSKHNGTWSSIHEWVPIKDYIDIFSFDIKDGFVFTYYGKHFIYWCDISIFLKLRCKTISDIREKNIDKLLQ